MNKLNIATLMLGAGLCMACNSGKVEWVSTTFDSPWQALEASKDKTEAAEATVIIDPANTLQTVEGFGTCASELSWDSLSALSPEERDEIFTEMFTPGAGANFVMARTPIGASDFAIEYYSYDDVDGDFGLEHFSVGRDENYLLPFLKSALAHNPDLKVWGSPWCPPSWMKTNKHFANTNPALRMGQVRRSVQEATPGMVPPQGGPGARPQGAPQGGPQARPQGAQAPRPAGGSSFGMDMNRMRDNGLTEEQQIREGTDAFILEPEYLDAYARYFGKYIDAYKEHGVDIFMVMPQNEPNSAQWYPACTWTPEGLKKFIAVLGPEMDKRGVEVWLGTIERANPALWDQIINDPDAGKFIKGMGFQWAGKDALPALHAEFPELPCFQTEQECGNGANDWSGAMHSWDLMKHYFKNGVKGYFYWNTSLFEGESSSWGWRQNSLVTVNRAAKTWKYTPEYYVIKHASHYVKPGAKVVDLGGNYDDALAFVNPDGKVVLLIGNQTEEPKAVTLKVAGKDRTVTLPAASLNTLVI